VRVCRGFFCVIVFPQFSPVTVIFPPSIAMKRVRVVSLKSCSYAAPIGWVLLCSLVWFGLFVNTAFSPWHASPVLQDPLSFHSITEPSTCSYRIGICVRAVCQHTPTPSPTPIPQADDFKSSFVALLWSAIVSDSSKELRWLINLELATGPAMPLSYLA
jgi:hypothetical protein